MAATIRDVAAQAGVSVSTASCALRGLALVKPSTRERVRAAAAMLGYEKDAAAALLSARRRSAVAHPKRLSFGWVVSQAMTTRRSMAFEERCRFYGYDSVAVDLSVFRDGRQASRTLWHRNIRGIYLASPGAFPEALSAGFEWARFSAVKFGRARPELSLHLIRHSPYDYARRCLGEVFAKGYRRVAVLLAPSASRWDDEARVGAVAGFREAASRRGDAVFWKSLGFPERGGPLRESDARWLRSVKPDAVIGFPAAWWFHLCVSGGVFSGMPFAAMLRSGSEGSEVSIAGCDARLTDAASMAVDLLHGAVLAGELGFAVEPREHVIEPVWVEGDTLGAVRGRSARSRTKRDA